MVKWLGINDKMAMPFGGFFIRIYILTYIIVTLAGEVVPDNKAAVVKQPLLIL